MKNKTKNHNKILFALIPLTALALYVMRIASGYNNSEGVIYIGYTSAYPLILFAEYAVITLLFIPFMLKAKKDERLNTYILPPMLFAALGMMRIDADKMITSREADHAPAIMFIIFFAAIILMAFSGHTVTGTAGTIIGTAFFPAFGLSFSPFIAAAAFLFSDKNKKEKTVSLIFNSVSFAAAAVYCIIKLEMTEVSFSKKYIPALFLAVASAVFFSLKKEYKLLPLAVLPLFPLVSGILLGAFATPIYTLAASVAPTVLTLGTAVTAGENEKLKGYAEKLLHNPALYIIVVVFILRTASSIFVAPGFFRDVYV